MEINVFLICVSLVIGANCNQRKVQFEKDTAVSGFTCSATEQIEGTILTQTIQMCMSVCASTDGCKSVFYAHSECVRCRSRYRKAGDARLLPMAGSVSYRTVVQCNPGWLSLQDSCYLSNAPTHMNFNQATDFCSILGAHVLYIDREEENDVPAKVLPETVAPNAWVWIGMYWTDGRWISSIDGKTVTYFNWYRTEPDYLNEQLCVTMYAGRQWQWENVMCHELPHAVCEIDM